jgi:hypothetical protein
MSETGVEYHVGNELPQNKKDKPMQKFIDLLTLAALCVAALALLPLLALWAMLAGMRLDRCAEDCDALCGGAGGGAHG